MPKYICQKHLCIGCGICAAICPKQCIDIKPNNLGQLKATINENKCISCNACVRTCPQASKSLVFELPQIVYAVSSKSKSAEVSKSTSSGFAYIVAKTTVQTGGIVYAAAFLNGKLIHQRMTNVDSLVKMQGSKYVQSTINTSTYRQIIDDAKSGKKVLFIGTPCQVAAVKSFAKSSFPNLYTIDLICHGTPSPIILHEYLRMNSLDSSTLSDIIFRDKEKYVFRCYKGDKVVLDKTIRNSSYIQAFLHNIFLNDACHNCQFSQMKRVSDITLGDFWGLNNKNFTHPSVVLVNSSKGKELLNISSFVQIESRTLNQVFPYQKALQSPAKMNMPSKIFRMIYRKGNFRMALTISTLPHSLKNILLKLLGK